MAACAGLWLVVTLFVACANPDPVHTLEDRLLAPCCWRQSLRDHDSELAAQLRTEIAQRVAAGEAPPRIEEDFVRRYGERIRALPAGTDPRWLVGSVAIGLAVVALAGLLWWGSRTRTRRDTENAAPVEADPRYADRLDDELAQVD